jgi:hypothetical protein
MPILGAQRLAVLTVGDQDVVHRLPHRDAALVAAAVGALGQDPRSAFLDADLAQQKREGHAGPLATAREAVRAGDALRRRLAPLELAIALTLQEENTRRRGQAPEVLHAQGHRTIDHAVNQQAVLRRVDVGNAAAVDLEVQCGRRDDPQRLVQRCGVADADLIRLAGRCPQSDRLLEARAFAVGPHWAPEDLAGVVGRRLGLAQARTPGPGPGQEARSQRGAMSEEPPAARVMGSAFSRWT